MTICFLARIRPKPEAVEALRAVLKDLVLPTRREEGCMTYNLHEEQTAQGVVFTFYEIWRDQADHSAHTETPHLQAFLARQADLIDGEIEITRLVPIEP